MRRVDRRRTRDARPAAEAALIAGHHDRAPADPAIYEFENAPPRSVDWLRQRYARLESRRSPDGKQRWLNWVLRLASGEAIGYVQATVLPDGRAAIAYELASRYWAVFKARNHRSLRLLQRLGFVPAGGDMEPDEMRMTREL